jgi:hypothetical protein
MEIPQITVNTQTIPNVYTPTWLREVPTVPFPMIPITQEVGVPVIQYPGCVTAHESNREQLKKDDPDKVQVFCDAGMPSFDSMDYNPDELEYIAPPVEAPKLDPPPTPELTTPEVPPIPPKEETECPAPNQPRVGDLTQDGSEKVIGHELQGTTCVVLYEDTTVAEKYLPSTNQVSTTAAIAVVATASAAATPLLLRVIKPVIKKLTTTIQKKLGKTPRKLSRQEIITNQYRQSKSLGPSKIVKKSRG